MKKSFKQGLICLIIIVLSGTAIHSQKSSSIDTLQHTTAGGEKKGMYSLGAASLVGGALAGFIVNGHDDYPRDGLPLISATITAAPSSLIGLGIGRLFAKKHSHFNDGFHIAVGSSYSSPVFSEFVPDNAHKMGPQIMLISPRLGAWRYKLGFSIFFEEEYEFDLIPSYFGQTSLNWWELDLNLQYIFDLNEEFKLYPFIGTQFNQVANGSNNLNSEFLANYGLGVQYGLDKNWNIFSEFQYTMDPDDNPSNTKIMLGVMRKI